MNESESTNKGLLNLEELHDLHIEYQDDASRSSGRPSLALSYPEFVSWWWELTDELRAETEGKYKKGFAQVILDNRDELKRLFPFPGVDQTNG